MKYLQLDVKQQQINQSINMFEYTRLSLLLVHAYY